IGGWAMNRAIDHGFIIGPGFDLPAHFSPIYFPMGNAATGFFVTFALIAGVVGVASVISGFNHVRFWNFDSLPAAASSATIAWTLTLLAMGFASKEIELQSKNRTMVLLTITYRTFGRKHQLMIIQPSNCLQRTMEAFVIILSATQLLYIAAIHGAA
ncbi:hypothetical protein RJ640_012782, partial [Escallonia rubra]